MTTVIDGRTLQLIDGDTEHAPEPCVLVQIESSIKQDCRRTVELFPDHGCYGSGEDIALPICERYAVQAERSRRHASVRARLTVSDVVYQSADDGFNIYSNES